MAIINSDSPNGTPRPAPRATSLFFGHEESLEEGEVTGPDPDVRVLEIEGVIVTVNVVEAVATVMVVVASVPARSARGRKVALSQWKELD